MIDLNAIPEALKQGENWELLKLDPEWVWLAEDEGAVVGILIAAPCHGIVLLWRVKMLPGAPHWALGRLFRRFIRDLRQRGMLGYMAFLDIVEQVNERALLRIAHRAGAIVVGSATIVCGSVSAKHVGDE